MPSITHAHGNKIQKQTNHGNRDSTLPNGHTKSTEADNGSKLKITASLSDSPRIMRRNTPANSGGSVTVNPKRGDSSTTHTVLRDDDGELRAVESTHDSRLQKSVRGRGEDILGTITVAEVSDTIGRCDDKPAVPMIPSPQDETFQIVVSIHKKGPTRRESLDVQKSYTVDKLKTMIAGRVGIPKEHQKLNYAGKNLLEMDKKLQDYRIEKGCSEILMTGNCRGG